LEDAKQLAGVVLADGQYSEVEKRTMRWIRHNYNFSIEADNWYRHEIASWASKKGHLVQRRYPQTPVRAEHVNTTGATPAITSPHPSNPQLGYVSSLSDPYPHQQALIIQTPQQQTYQQQQVALGGPVTGGTTQPIAAPQSPIVPGVIHPSSPWPVNVPTHLSFEDHQPTLALLGEEEKKFKEEVDKWFENCQIEGVRKLATEVKAMELRAVLAVTRDDWQAMTQNVLATVSIVTFLQKFQTFFMIQYTNALFA